MSKVFSAMHRGVYKLSGGRLGGSFGESKVILVTTTGRLGHGPHSAGRGVVGARGHRPPGQDQPKPGLHARLLQLRGAKNRGQDGNYNGSMRKYLRFMADVRDHITDNVILTTR